MSLLAAARRRTRGADQGGFTLIEAVIALLLCTILVIALVRGLLTTVKVDNADYATQRMNAELHSFGESLKDLPYQPCAPPDWYQAVFADALAPVAPADRKKTFGVEAPEDVNVLAVEYATASEFPVGSDKQVLNRDLGDFGPDCSIDQGAQKVTFEVRFNGRTRTGQVVKRNPYGLTYEEFATGTTTTAPLGSNTPPHAGIRETSNGGGSFTFTSASFDAEGPIASASWDFGDASPPASGNEVTHTYGAGMFVVRLTVTDSGGATATAVKTVRVSGTPAVPTEFKLFDVRHGGGTNASYDFTWKPVPGVQRYEIRLEWSIDLPWPFNRRDCYGTEYHQFSASPGTITRSFPYVPFYVASIRAQVGSDWSAWSDEIQGWAP